MSAILGMRGTGDWASEQRPKSWREKILRLYPNGDAPLTAILSKMKSEALTDPEFSWWTKAFPTQAADVTDVYTDVLTTAYTTGGTLGQALYIKVSAAHAAYFRAGHQVLLMNTANFADNTNAKVTGVVFNGANSYVAVKLLQADPTTNGIADCNRLLIIGNINAEGAAMPDAISYNPTKLYNFTQIFRTPLSITRTARKTNLRTGDQYKESKREALELHSIEMEKAFLWGIRTEGIGSNGKPERTTAGMLSSIISNSGNVSDFTADSDFLNSTWLESGEAWLNKWLEQIFRYGGNSRTAFVGSGTVLAINSLITEYGHFEYTPDTAEYGVKVKTWGTPFGEIHMMIHPLFSFEPAHRHTMAIFDPKDLIYRYIDDTTFYGEKEQQNTGRGRIDGTDEEFLTECGLEFHHYTKTAFLSGFGSDNGTP